MPRTRCPERNKFGEGCLKYAGHGGEHIDATMRAWVSPPPTQRRCKEVHPQTGFRCTKPFGHPDAHAVSGAGRWTTNSPQPPQVPQYVPQAWPNGIAAPNIVVGDLGYTTIEPKMMNYHANVSEETAIKRFLQSPEGREILIQAVLAAMDRVADESVGGG